MVRFPSTQRMFRFAIILLLLEIVHKLATLQRLMELQDSSNHLDGLMGWSPHERQNHQHDDEQENSEAPLSSSSNNRQTNNGLSSKAHVGSNSASRTTMDVCRIPPSEGPEGSMGFQALTKIQVHPPPSVPSLRLLCIVVTDSTHHATTLPAILETYASSCDGFLAVSNKTDSQVRAVELSGDNDWERLQRIWKYVQKYDDDYSKQGNTGNFHSFDAFHFGIESSFVIPQNLVRMLSTYSEFKDSQNPMYLGGAVVAVRKNPQIRHCGGQAGYTLNRAALQLSERLSECSSTTMIPDETLLPVDQILARCLREIADLQCIKTVDEDSALRYIEFGLDYQARFTTKTKKYVKRTPVKVKPLAEYHGIYIRDGLDGIASDAVAFSVLNFRGNNHTWDEDGFTVADSIRRVDAILKRTCKPVWDDPPVLALDVDGAPGYLHDATYLRRHPPNMTAFPKGDDYGVCQMPFGSGREGDDGYQGLKKIRIMETDNTGEARKKVLCMIYTHSRRHNNRLRSIAETYGPRCDGFLAASNKTDPSIGAVNLLHEGPEAYENMWLKVRSMWKYAYQHYLDEYDLFHIGGDDHYLIPENLVYMAGVGSWKGPWNFSEPLFLGGSMVDFPMTNIRYCGGGGGYTLNRVALKLLVEDLFDIYKCRPHHQASDEDRIISDCFRSIGLSCMDTNDQSNETRYHQASADFHAGWTRDKAAVWHAGPLERVHGIASKERLGQISESTVSFHLKGMPKGVQDRGMRRYHVILHNLCKGTTLTTLATKFKMQGSVETDR